MKLLLPVDGSFASVKAVEKAVEIAKKYGFSIKMISVIEPHELQKYKRNAKLFQQADGSIMDINVKPIDDDEVLRVMHKRANETMDTILSGVDFSNVPFEKEVLIGEPYEEIIKTAEDEGFDLIVMGNRGFSKIKRFFIGSVAQKVISEAPCPVLVIHGAAKE